MNRIQAIKAELDADPLARGYSGMTDAEAASSMMDTIDRTVNREEISGDDAFGATDDNEFVGLSNIKKQLWLAFCARDAIDPFRAANVAFVRYIFGNTSDTVSNLQGVRTQTTNRAIELGLGRVRAGDIAQARAL